MQWELEIIMVIIIMVKPRRMGWEGHVARMGDRCTQGFGWGKPEIKETIWKTQAWMGG
jgi:hypothetical protein